MAHIVDLSEYRRRRRPARRASATPAPVPVAAGRPGPHYFCLRCNAETFKCFSTGIVHCAQCGARMRNLAISETPGDRRPNDRQP